MRGDTDATRIRPVADARGAGKSPTTEFNEGLTMTNIQTDANGLAAPLAGTDREAVATYLDALADQTRDTRFNRAAGALRGRLGGRPQCGDADSLRRMAALLACGHAASVSAAARYIAATLRDEHATEAAACRLARKFRRMRESN
jgi:hypothetical protein